MADDPIDNEPVDPVTADLLERQKQAEARRAIADAQRAEVQAVLPTIDLPDNDGTLDTSAMGVLFSELNVARAARAAAERMAVELVESGLGEGKTIWLTTTAMSDGVARTALDAVGLVAQLEHLLDRIEPRVLVIERGGSGAEDAGRRNVTGDIALATAPVTAGVSVISELVTTAIPVLVKALSVDTTISGGTSTVDDRVLTSLAARALLDRRLRVRIGAEQTRVATENGPRQRLEEILKRREELNVELAPLAASAEARRRTIASAAETRAVRIELAKTYLEKNEVSQAEALALMNECLDAADPPDEENADRRAVLEGATATIDAATAALTAADGTHPAPIDLAEFWASIDDDWIELRVSAPTAGYENITRDRRFGTDDSQFFGGVVLAYVALDKSGELLAANAIDELAASKVHLGRGERTWFESIRRV